MQRRRFVQMLPVAMLAASANSTAGGLLKPARHHESHQEATMNETHSAASDHHMQHVLVFDVIETLLDLNAMAPRFEAAFGTPDALKEFFAQMLQSAFAITAAGIYADFGTVAKAALSMTAAKRNIVLTDEGTMKILSGLRALPPHPEVPASLQRLKAAGFKLAALTNSALPVLEAQMRHAGIRDYFDSLLTVDTVKRFKPAPGVYQAAASTLGVTTKQIRMIAAHSWDVGGAMQAGCAAAFVARPGMVLDPLFQTPDIVGNDLGEVATLILNKEASHKNHA